MKQLLSDQVMVDAVVLKACEFRSEEDSRQATAGHQTAELGRPVVSTASLESGSVRAKAREFLRVT